MSGIKRPSGAVIGVYKGGLSEPERSQQVELLRYAGGLAVPVLADMADGFLLQLCDPPRVPTQVESRIVLAQFQRLWGLSPAPETVRPRATMHEYTRYIEEREETCPQVKTLKATFRRVLADTGPYVMRHQFVHGDATLSNVVWLGQMPRFIDISPRPTPSDRRVDLAKLWFSATGFDSWLGEPAAAMFRRTLLEYEPLDGANWVTGELKDPLMRALYLSHCVRVASKEPERAVHIASMAHQVCGVRV